MSFLGKAAKQTVARLACVSLLIAAPLATVLVSAEPAGASVIPIMSPSRLNPGQLVNWFNASTRSPYRASASIQDMANYYVGEGQVARVRGDIAFIQSVLETGWFSFPAGGYIVPTDNNFAGIGAYGNGSNVKRWASAQLGVRAQIQLLRRYSDASSNQYNIGYAPDPVLWNPASRYDVPGGTHGWAPTWQSLSGTWASSTAYADSIMRLYNAALKYNGQPTDCPVQSLAIGGAGGATAGCPADIAMPGRAIGVRAQGGYYVLNGNGSVTASGGAPGGNGPMFGWDIARDIAVMPDGGGYIVLDGYGGLHPFGSAQSLPFSQGAYWPGWDIARRVAITSTGAGLGVLDGWGGIHSAGDAPSVVSAWWKGWDIARGLAFTPNNQGTYVVDGWGGVHAAGTAVALGSPYWFNWDVGRDIVAAPSGTGYAVLDAFGAIHGYGNAANGGVAGYLPADVWRGIDTSGGSYMAVRNDGVAQTG